VDYLRSAYTSTMNVAAENEPPHVIPVTWYFAPLGAKYFSRPNLFSSSVWDPNHEAATVTTGEQTPLARPNYYGGANVWDYLGQCMIGSVSQYATGLTAAEIATPRPIPDCCRRMRWVLGLRAEQRLLLPPPNNPLDRLGVAARHALLLPPPNNPLDRLGMAARHALLLPPPNNPLDRLGVAARHALLLPPPNPPHARLALAVEHGLLPPPPSPPLVRPALAVAHELLLPPPSPPLVRPALAVAHELLLPPPNPPLVRPALAVAHELLLPPPNPPLVRLGVAASFGLVLAAGPPTPGHTCATAGNLTLGTPGPNSGSTGTIDWWIIPSVTAGTYHVARTFTGSGSISGNVASGSCPFPTGVAFFFGSGSTSFSWPGGNMYIQVNVTSSGGGSWSYTVTVS